VTSAQDLRNLTDSELEEKLQGARQELFNLRFRHATKQLDNTGRIGIVRREIARLLTLVRERKLAL
jgi:large subunit ribosomal protein L29